VTIKGSLLMSFPIIKRFLAEKFFPPKRGLKIHVFGGLGGEMFELDVETP